jgi:hypothetical protein
MLADATDTESASGPWSVSLSLLRVGLLFDEVFPVAVRESATETSVAVMDGSWSVIAASAAFLFLVRGGVVKIYACGKPICAD